MSDSGSPETDSYPRTGHFLAGRLRMVGMGTPNGFDTPLTQQALAELVGATPVHVNRALRELREGGYADFTRGKVSFGGFSKLADFGAFEADYLYGEGTIHLREGYG